MAFAVALGLVFAAEMGDKTQLVALAFASRYSARVVLAAVFVATLLVHILSVALGRSAAFLLSRGWIDTLAGVAFVGFGLWTVRGDEIDDDDSNEGTKWGPFMTVASSFFIAELGDKTMLTTVAVASRYSSFVEVWLGSTVGMVAADGLAVLAGVVLGKRLPERAIRYGAAAIFFATGVYTIVQGVRALHG
jgi:putative Ca2+/H+ antiporter (TMEM165/GDT1 family)